MGTRKVGTYNCVELSDAAGSRGDGRPLIRLRVSHLWIQTGLWPWFDPCPVQGRAFTAGTPQREAAFTVMYCTVQCAAATERGGQGFKREKICVRRKKGTERERRHNERVKISLPHPEKNSSMCY